MKDANEVLVARGLEGFVSTWARSRAEAAAPPSESHETPGTAAKEEKLIEPPAAPVPPVLPVSPVPSVSPGPSLVQDDQGTYVFDLPPRTYSVRGLAAFGVDRLRVNLRVDQGPRFHVDTFDLYSARSRHAFIESAVKALRLDDGRLVQVGEEVDQLILALEKERLVLRKEGKGEAGEGKDAKERAMPASEREEALGFLSSPNLVELLLSDFRASGCVGEETALLIGYFALVSRKLQRPLSVLFCARSGAGKSTLQDRLSELVPPEDLVKYTRISGQALFYKDTDALKHKLIVVEEEDGASSAAYALRSLISSGVLRASVTRTDPRTGRQVAEDYLVNGPVVIFLTSAHPEVLDYETRNRFVLLTIDESKEQTRRILKWQRWDETAEGLLFRHRTKSIQRKHHNAQRLLEPLEVVIPLDLPFPEGHLILRREQRKYHQLLKAIALLHQHQRPRKTVRGEAGETIEYIEVTEEDVVIAKGLAPMILARNLDELAPPTRSLLDEIGKLVEAKRKAAVPAVAAPPPNGAAASDDPARPGAGGRGDACERLLLDRHEIQRATGLSLWHIKEYLAQLVEYEYLALVSGRKGKRCLYELLWSGEEGDGPAAGAPLSAPSVSSAQRAVKQPEEPGGT